MVGVVVLRMKLEFGPRGKQGYPSAIDQLSVCRWLTSLIFSMAGDAEDAEEVGGSGLRGGERAEDDGEGEM